MQLRHFQVLHSVASLEHMGNLHILGGMNVEPRIFKSRVPVEAQRTNGCSDKLGMLKASMHSLNEHESSAHGRIMFP